MYMCGWVFCVLANWTYTWCILLIHTTYEDGIDREFQTVIMCNSDAGESPKRKNTTVTTQQILKSRIKHIFNTYFFPKRSLCLKLYWLFMVKGFCIIEYLYIHSDGSYIIWSHSKATVFWCKFSHFRGRCSSDCGLLDFYNVQCKDFVMIFLMSKVL